MDLDDLIITAFCMIDDSMKQLFSNIRLRQRGPAPALSDSETLTMEVVGEYLSLNQDKASMTTSEDTTRISSRLWQRYIAPHSSDRLPTSGASRRWYGSICSNRSDTTHL